MGYKTKISDGNKNGGQPALPAVHCDAISANPLLLPLIKDGFRLWDDHFLCGIPIYADKIDARGSYREQHPTFGLDNTGYLTTIKVVDGHTATCRPFY